MPATKDFMPLVDQLNGSIKAPIIAADVVNDTNAPFLDVSPQQALEILFTFLPDPGEPKATFKPRICSQNLRRVDKGIAKMFALDVDSIKTHVLGDLENDQAILGKNGARLRKISMIVKKLI